MMVNYFKDVSNMLALVSAVRTGDIPQQPPAERNMFNLVFALDHMNLLTTNFLHHIETSQLICNSNQSTGF